MFFPMVLVKLLDWIIYNLLANSFLRAARKLKRNFRPNNNKPIRTSPITASHVASSRPYATAVCDIHGGLIQTQSFFPFFMLVAFEAGGVLRALSLLLSCLFLWAMDYDSKLRVMTFLTFRGLGTKAMDGVSRAVLPKFFLESLDVFAYEVFSMAETKIVVTSLPRVLVEGFLKEYLDVDEVIGTELETSGKCFTGFVADSGLVVKHRALKHRFGDDHNMPDIGLGTSCFHDQLFISLCKESYIVNEKTSSSKLPREKYPKPLVFHDGRLAFLPTPAATLAMFMWLPFGIILAVIRISVGFLPFKIGLLLGTFFGIFITVEGPTDTIPSDPSRNKGILYVCNHRTLVDPVFLSVSVAKPVTAVTYSLSKMSEFISTIRTVRLTRDRDHDGHTMRKILEQDGDLVVCPEGTTCREPYLLRFSSLFAELSDDIVPVAVEAKVTMFYGTTASGLKCLDPFFFFMNPRPSYSLKFLGKVPDEMTCGRGGKSSFEVANFIQKQLAEALGFECTNLTRRDKYLMLAGNDGIVNDNHSKNGKKNPS